MVCPRPPHHLSLGTTTWLHTPAIAVALAPINALLCSVMGLRSAVYPRRRCASTSPRRYAPGTAASPFQPGIGLRLAAIRPSTPWRTLSRYNWSRAVWDLPDRPNITEVVHAGCPRVRHPDSVKGLLRHRSGRITTHYSASADAPERVRQPAPSTVLPMGHARVVQAQPESAAAFPKLSDL